MAKTNPIEYRPIDGFPGYRVGDDGSVWYAWRTCSAGRILTDRWRLMKLATNAKGYLSVNITPPEGWKYKTFRVHRLVLLAFVGPCPDGMECRHLNGIKADNRLSNLVWGTRKENIADNHANGTYAKLRTAKNFTYLGKTMCLKEWAAHFEIPYLCLWYRVSRLGMTFEEAVTRPYHGTASNGGHWNKLKLRRRRACDADC